MTSDMLPVRMELDGVTVKDDTRGFNVFFIVYIRFMVPYYIFMNVVYHTSALLPPVLVDVGVLSRGIGSCDRFIPSNLSPLPLYIPSIHS